MAFLLVIDDDPFTLECFRALFPAGEVTVATAETATAGLNLFSQKQPDVVMLDIRLPDQSGLEVFRRLHDINPKVPVIVMTGHGTTETAIEAMRLGAYEYVVKPLNPEPLRQLIQAAFEISRLMQAPVTLADPEPANDTEDILVGASLEMQDVYKGIGRVAPQNVTVLILGESGTGKELVARAIYHHSSRSNEPFLAMNCAAIPEPLLESELFGHEKGSFTGADRKRIGKFEQCNGGTLFLDEIGDMTPLTQTKILRVLQDGQFERVGSNETIKTDVRIIAATNRDLGKLIEEERFRQDLYYRLNVYTIRLPPLRERAGDLPLLTQHFIRRFSRELGREVQEVAPEALARLRAYSWPGNIRELQSVLKQALLKARGTTLLPNFLPKLQEAPAPRLGAGSQTPATSSMAHSEPLHGPEAFVIRHRLDPDSRDLYAETHRELDRLLLPRVLEYTSGNQHRAARHLGIARQTLHAKLNELGSQSPPSPWSRQRVKK
jgi:two-component system, NtrC family, nitrogen regulation response regulator GlnG